MSKAHYDKWKNLISKMGLLQTSRLCWRHFDETDVLKGETFYPEERWRLKDVTLPKYFLGLFQLKVVERSPSFQRES